jgi:SAM-dependent methyltransferase/uncharacterized protein YbaR (Trm112 family)
MPLKEALLPLLRCPSCRGTFDFTPAPANPLACAEFGVLRCQCSTFPVVDGIPIIQKNPVGMFEHTTGATQVAGTSPGRLVDLIEGGRAIEALLECLVFPLVLPLAKRVFGYRVATRFGRWLCKRRLCAEVLAKRETITAIEVFGFYQQSPYFHEIGHYFNLRLCQPRHLAALSLLANVRGSEEPLLDIACGLGHFEHYLSERREPVAAVGVDMNFFHLWIARHWIAPTCTYVCSNVSDGLPFGDGCFSAVFCSDAYHYIPNRHALLNEIARCAPSRPVILARAGNAEVMPKEGIERSVTGYLEEMNAAQVHVFGETDLLERYLERRNPLAEPPGDPESQRRSKWLSFSWNLAAAPGDLREEKWPHAVGTLGINPIYRRWGTAGDGVTLWFEFPSTWYAYENHAMLSYHPQSVTLTAAQLAALRAGRTDESFEELVRQFVLIGMPRRFAPAA